MSSEIHDISPLVHPDLKVFPGDTPPAREVLMDLSQGDPLTLSTLRSTVHVGAHLDAPSHYGVVAPSIERFPLEIGLGPCQVMRVSAARGSRLRLEDLPAEVTEPRLLLATGTFPDPTRWDGDFAALDPQLVHDLADRGVRLVGIDTPSVDPADSKDLPAHHAFLAREMYILEGIVLTAVPEGCYELIALPLKLDGFDASPVRAVLRSRGA